MRHGQGLNHSTDAKLIERLDHCVPDSLAGFGTDEWWSSDTRVVHIGGDRKLRYAFSRLRFHRASSQETRDTVQAFGSQRSLQAASTTALAWDYKAKQIGRAHV